MRVRFFSALVLCMVMLASCSKPSSVPADEPGAAAGTKGTTDGAGDKPRVAFVYIGVPGDGGWTYQHDLARQAVEETFGIRATVMENVPDNADAERVFTELAMNHDIIFGTSFGYMDAMYNVARKFPDVVFLHSTGYKVESV
ncbi:MAG: hypothetical protein BAA01_13320 [Bacillus thermozeamaize]|uniref:ABC transporter substrate-binding protein PnrA-like domain-containing protein n=1 Tax=Bacillus thermozeamaize TaxID=230954 RepID=A0A1Y3PXB6_9BACI|nr:MAG: hypothetical protein BAA01_13320 [Bacillus thermozeamaize]